MTCGKPYNDNNDIVPDMEMDTSLKENEIREDKQVQSNDGKEEETGEQ